jgi:type I site-specific restriction endonuclease
MNEADTCRRLITPKLQAAGWDTDPHSIAEAFRERVKTVACSRTHSDSEHKGCDSLLAVFCVAQTGGGEYCYGHFLKIP